MFPTVPVPFPAPTSSGGGVGSLLNPHQDSLPPFSFLKVTVLLWKAGHYIIPRVPFTAAPATFLEAMWLLLPSRRYSHLTEEPEADLRVGELIQSCSYAERTKLHWPGRQRSELSVPAPVFIGFMLFFHLCKVGPL